MSKFISRKQLEVQHSRSYEMREKLKELGCEWDGIARAWIAPSVEVKELCYQILEESEGRSGIKHRYLGQCGWDSIDYEKFEQQEESPSSFRLIIYTPELPEIEKIFGSEAILRYWHPDIPQEASKILASGEQNRLAIDDRLHEKGWGTRQISLLLDVVDHFREHPPVADSQASILITPSVANVKAIPEIELDGSIAVLSDSDGEPIAFAITFPYSNQMVNRVKWLPGRKWNSKQKRWEVPIDSKHGAEDVFKTFPHFTRSPKAAEIEARRNQSV